MGKKILLGAVISLTVLALGAWIAFRLHFSWISIEDRLNMTATQQGENVHLDIMGMFDMVFRTDEPVAFVGNERIAMRDGLRIRNGRPYISMRDTGIFDDDLGAALAAIANADNSAPVGVIVNGLYGQGTAAQNELIRSLLGGQARERFEVYFQWYNTIHELGHLITMHNGTYDPDNMENTRHMVDEEVLVNSFAVAFWTLYGEEEKINALEDMVEYVLNNITPPVNNMSHLDYMREAVDKRNMRAFTFENYGWFQFSMVRDILRKRDTLDLASLLSQMTGTNVQIQPHQRLEYPALGTDRVPEIIADVREILCGWGIAIPDVYVTFSTDPNENSLQYPIPRVLLAPNIAAARVIPAYR